MDFMDAWTTLSFALLLHFGPLGVQIRCSNRGGHYFCKVNRAHGTALARGPGPFSRHSARAIPQLVDGQADSDCDSIPSSQYRTGAAI